MTGLRLLALRCGSIEIDAGVLDGGGLSGQSRTVPSMCFVVEHPAGRLVWDTSMHPAVCDDPVGYWGVVAESIAIPKMTVDETLPALLGVAGVGQGEVTFVANSHLHNDHCGANRLLPGATVLSRSSEYDQAVDAATNPYSGYVAGDFVGDGQRREAFDYSDSYDLFGDGSVRFLDTPGHTPGHQSLLVTFASGRSFVLSGDAVYNQGQLNAGSPPGLTVDRAAAVDSARRLQALAGSGARVLIHHDIAQWGLAAPVTLVHAEA
jgi:N-acyl homoserine lactone hydrolase